MIGRCFMSSVEPISSSSSSSGLGNAYFNLMKKSQRDVETYKRVTKDKRKESAENDTRNSAYYMKSNDKEWYA